MCMYNSVDVLYLCNGKPFGTPDCYKREELCYKVGGPCTHTHNAEYALTLPEYRKFAWIGKDVLFEVENIENTRWPDAEI